MSGLTNKYVENLGKHYLKTFAGVFPCNTHPDVKESEHFSVIFNESKHNEEGTHFVAIFANKQHLYYFDSLGLKLENRYIKLFCTSQGRRLVENKEQIQSFDSLFCGYFCVCFIMYMEATMDFSQFCNHFCKSNLKINDTIVVDFIIKLAKKWPHSFLRTFPKTQAQVKLCPNTGWL